MLKTSAIAVPYVYRVAAVGCSAIVAFSRRQRLRIKLHVYAYKYIITGIGREGTVIPVGYVQQ